MSEAYETLRKFYIREAERETRAKKWRRFWHEALVVFVACVIIALFVWAVGLGR
jgi:hypothetical protein